MHIETTGFRRLHADFGEQLRAARVRRGVTQRQLADLSTVSVRAIRDLETGRAQRPRQDTVRLIADGLGLTGRARIAFEDSARAAAGVDANADGYTGPPPALDTLIGRERDVAALTELLVTGDQRLVTVVGVGGVGKSRLAQHVAATLHDTGRMQVRWLVHDEHPDEPTASSGTVARWPDTPSLLVLDGYEPAPDLAQRVTATLGGCLSLRVLITARAPLEVIGERTFPLGPLAVPPVRAKSPHEPMHGMGVATRFPAMALFVRCIREVRPDFRPNAADTAALATLCHLLDGIPSALAAAASWLLVFEPAELLERVTTDPFAIVGPDLIGDPLLDGVPEQALLRDLSEINGAWSISEAVAVTGASLAACHRMVHWLVMRGVVKYGRSTDGVVDGPRFRLLELVKASYRARTPLFAEAT